MRETPHNVFKFELLVCLMLKGPHLPIFHSFDQGLFSVEKTNFFIISILSQFIFLSHEGVVSYSYLISQKLISDRCYDSFIVTD